MSEQAKNTGGELLENAVKQVEDVEASESAEIKSTVSRIALMVPWLLKPEDFGSLVSELDAIRNPVEEEQSLLKAVEKNVSEQVQETPVAANDNYPPSIKKQSA